MASSAVRLLIALLVALGLLGWIFFRFLGHVPNPMTPWVTSADFWWAVLVAIAIGVALVWNRLKNGRWLNP
jgi:hypothetical protein